MMTYTMHNTALSKLEYLKVRKIAKQKMAYLEMLYSTFNCHRRIEVIGFLCLIFYKNIVPIINRYGNVTFSCVVRHGKQFQALHLIFSLICQSCSGSCQINYVVI